MNIPLEQTCVLIKPDAMENGNAGKILQYFEAENFRIIGCKLIQLNDEMLHEHYANVEGEDFFSDLKIFMKSRPVMALVLTGKNAVQKVRTMCGKNYQDAGTIRGEFATCPRKNAIHSSDSKENAEQEIARFFSESEVFSVI